MGNCEPLLGEHGKRIGCRLSETSHPPHSESVPGPALVLRRADCNRGDSPRGSTAPRFQIGDRALIEPGSPAKPGLRQPALPAMGSNSFFQARREGRRVVAKEAKQPGPPTHQRLRPPALPVRNALLADAELPAKGSLRHPQVEPTAPQVVAQGAEGSRVTPWQDARSGRHKPNATERQRNAASAAGSGTRSAGAGARRPSWLRYTARVSGPILDRIDIQVEVPALTSTELLTASAGESSAIVRQRVLSARERQAARGTFNALLTNAALREHCALDAASHRLIADAMDRGGMSARAVHRALRVARTIADLASENRVGMMRIAEALQYRAYERRSTGAHAGD